VTDLFEDQRKKALSREAPLAARMRSRTFDEFVGQEHLLGPDRVLRKAIESDQLPSLVLWGPPGSGKTYTASHAIASLLSSGKKVGVASNSHKAVVNLLIACGEAVRESGYRLDGIKVGGEDEGPLYSSNPDLHHIKDNAGAYTAYQSGVIGGTAWLFTRPEWEPPVLLTAAHTGDGIGELWEQIKKHQAFAEANSQLQDRRERRREQEFLEIVEEELAKRLKALVYENPGLSSALNAVANKGLEPYSSAMEFLSAGIELKPGWNLGTSQAEDRD